MLVGWLVSGVRISVMYGFLAEPVNDPAGVQVRFLRRADRAAWHELVADNREWLAPWSATDPLGGPVGQQRFGRLRRRALADARAGKRFFYVVTAADQLVGVVTLTAVQWGATCSAALGYWVGQDFAGRGIAPTAAALVLRHALTRLGLHRVEVLIRPENAASLRVMAKLALREEGVRQRLIHIDGQWRDHRCFAITAEEYRASLWDAYLTEPRQKPNIG